MLFPWQAYGVSAILKLDTPQEIFMNTVSLSLSPLESRSITLEVLVTKFHALFRALTVSEFPEHA